MDLLKLIALDDEDLNIISAHLQDAVLHVGDMAYLPAERRFAAVVSRFDWLRAADSTHDRRHAFERRRTALRFERVLGAQVQNLSLADKRVVLELLAIRFEGDEPPGGHVTLIFAGGGAVRLKVECIEAELKDLGPAWHTAVKPEHALDADDPSRDDGAAGSDTG